MERTKKKINLEPVIIHPRGRNPTFSSTLLESIYHSIDQSSDTNKAHTTTTLEEEISMSLYKRDHSMRKNQLWSFKGRDDEKVEKVMNKFSHGAVLSNSNSNSSSSSSESSFWSGGLSSSDSESAHTYYGPKSRSSSSCYSMQRPKPIRTERSSSHGPSPKPKNHHHHHDQDKVTKMSKALKIYNELKKVKKQPISPGGRLSSFLNSLFNTHSKKNNNGSKPSSKGFEEPSKSNHSSYVSTPNCSSASSYARSCLSKTPSSKLSNNGSKRSVRFSVIVDEDSKPCGHKKLQEEEDDEVKIRVMEENMKVVEAARKLLESYQKSNKESYGGIKGDVDIVSEDDDDYDVMSCSSSDLFELNNLSDIGFTTRYSEELPVYETTHVDTNRAIANGLVL